MDLKLKKETIAVKENVMDTCFEHSVETDYILPDYYPDIFRIIKCKLIPKIVSQSIVGNDITGENKKMSYELEVLIRIWYLSENSKVINCIDLKTDFTKSADVSIHSKYPEITIMPRCDYANCRVINKRRLDIRGAVTTKVRIVDDKCRNVICDAEGMNIQLKKNMIVYPSQRLITSKKITVIEELELGIAKPPIISVIKSDSKIISKEHKTISNKIVVKGDTQIDMLYICSRDDDHGIESMKFSVPFSQIIDFEGIDDSYEIVSEVYPSSCDIITKGNGESTSFECELVLFITCIAYKKLSGDVIVDAYSTNYDCSIDMENLEFETTVKEICENTICKNSLTVNDNEINSVIDCSCEITNISTHLSDDDSSFIINGNLNYSSLLETKDGYPIVCENDTVFECKITSPEKIENCYFEPKVRISGCNYTMTSNNVIDVSADLIIEGTITQKYNKKVITDIKVDSESKKQEQGNCALKLYFTEENEDIWEIAKRNSTSVKAILEENNITSDKVFEKGMLLIPIIN